MRWVGHIIVGGKREVYTGFLLGKFEGNRPFARPRHRWKIVFKLTLKK